MTRKISEPDVFEKNVALLDRETAKCLEKRIALFAEPTHLLADRLASAVQKGSSRKELLRNLCLGIPPVSLHDHALPAHRPSLYRAFASLSALDRVSFVQALLERFAILGHPLCAKELLPCEDTPLGRVAYFRNPYTDEAYEIFCEQLPSPTVQYTDSFRLSCEAVYDGSASFCILPIANTEGELSTFTDMADELELVRVALCRIFHADGTDVTHFALYAKAFFFPGDEDRHLRFSVPLQGAQEIACLMSALSLLGTEPITLSGKDSEDGEHTLLSLVCRVSAESCIPLLTYLTVFADGWRFLGLYRDLS